MATLTIGAVQWRLYSPDTPDLVAPYLVDFTQYGAYDFVPRGAQALLTTGSVASADGVVIDNMQNANDCTITVGAITEFCPRYQKLTIPLPGISAPDVVLTAAGGTTRVTFYTGTYHGTGSNINGYASNKAGAVSTVTDGTIDAYFNSLRWKINYNLSAGFNLDNITDSGFYDVLNPTNGGTALPAGTWYVEHHTYSSSTLYAFQIARNLVAPVAAIYERRLLGGNGWTAWTRVGGAAGNGQCQFVCTSATNCSLVPKDGQTIIVNGQAYKLPQAGLNLSNSGLAASTAYFIYLQVAADGVTGSLLASTTAHVTGADGTEVMNGDASKALVGWVMTDANSKFQDTDAARLVMSWFNRRRVRATSGQTSGATSSNGTYVALTAFAIQFASWGDRPHMFFSGYVSSSYNGGHSYFNRLLLDGNPTGPEMLTQVANPYATDAGVETLATVLEGAHTAGMQAHIDAAAVATTWYGEVTVETWI